MQIRPVIGFVAKFECFQFIFFFLERIRLWLKGNLCIIAKALSYIKGGIRDAIGREIYFNPLHEMHAVRTLPWPRYPGTSPGPSSNYFMAFLSLPP